MKTFEFKSQICTTKEQSERLLKLGIKKETADMWYPHFASTYPIPLTEDDVMTDRDIPAWSLHRLMKLLPKELKLDDKRLEFFITYDLDVMLVDERNEEYLTLFANNIYESLVEYAEILKTFNVI